MARAGTRALGVALSVLVASCAGSSEHAPRSAGVSLLDAPKPSPAEFVTPAVFRYHPHEAAPMTARAVLPDGSVVFAGQRGERWLVSPGAKTATSAAEIAPEELVLIQRKDHGFVFVGRSGTSYESVDPVGPFLRSRAPLEPLVRIGAAGTVLVGVRRDGAIVRSEDGGAAWAHVGPDGVRFHDIALRSDGKGLALALPERFFETNDFGASFSELVLPSAGAEELVPDESAGVVVTTALGPRRWDPESRTLVPPSAPLSARAQSIGVPVPLGPSSIALSQGSAVMIADRWMEVRPVERKKPDRPQTEDQWTLVTGQFGGSLEGTPLPFTKGCISSQIAGSERVQYVACIREKIPSRSGPIEIHRSEDLGRTWKTEPYVIEGTSNDFRMVVAADGELVLSGICPWLLRGPGCRPVGIHRRGSVDTDGGSTGLGFVPAATPSLSGTLLSLVASFDGRTLYALGRRSKSDALAVFVSHDGGKVFEARDVDALRVPDDDGRRPPDSVEIESAAAAEDGTVAFIVKRRGATAWLVVDDEGRTLALSKPPVEGAALGAAGQRGLAISPSVLEAWESLDGGATFSPLGKLPLDPGRGPGDRATRLACTARGCVINDRVSRIGWRGDQRVAALPPPSTPAPARRQQKVGTPFACVLDGGEWKRVVSAAESRSAWNASPHAEQAVMGRVAWFSLRTDVDSASASMVHMRLGRDAGIEEVPLLDHAANPSEVAFVAMQQIEGGAALRFVIPKDIRDPNLKRVEVAWDDVLEGRVVHGVIPDAGPFRAGDYRDDGARPRHIASPALLSVASRGIYVRAHDKPGEDQPTYFLDGHAVEAIPPVPWPDGGEHLFHPEMVHAGKAHVPLRMTLTRLPDNTLELGATVVRARRTDRGWTFDAATLGLPKWKAKAFGVGQEVGIAYVGDASAFIVQSTDGREATSLVYPFRAEGPLLDAPIHVPTQLDLPGTPRPCTSGDRAATPRVVAPYQNGTRHPVVVTDAVEPLRVLLSNDAVVHGTPEAPCAAAYEAELVASEGAPLGQQEHALVLVDPAERSYLFRTAQGSASFEFRGMSCRMDPAAEIPREILIRDGTHIEVR